MSAGVLRLGKLQGLGPAAIGLAAACSVSDAHTSSSEEEVFGIPETTAQFNDVTYSVQDKHYLAGTLQEYQIEEGDPALYAIQFYPQDVIAEDTVLTAVQQVKRTFAIPDARLAFVATDPQQTTATVDGAIEAEGVENLTLDEVLGTLDHDVLREFDGKPILPVVGPDGLQIELSMEAIIREKLAEKLDKPWQLFELDPDAEITSYDDMCPADEADWLGVPGKWGDKSTGLGFLRHQNVLGRVDQPGTLSAQLGYDISPPGIGVTVQCYFDFIDENPDLKETIAEFIELEKAGTISVAERVDRLDAIRVAILAGTRT